MASAAAETMRCCGGGRIMLDHSSKKVFAKCSPLAPMVAWSHLEVVSERSTWFMGSSRPKGYVLSKW